MACKLFAGPILALALALAAAPTPVAAQTARQPNPYAEARKQISAARAQVTEIKKEQQRLKAKLMAEFESKEEWKNTASNHKKAKLAYDKAQKEAKKALLSKPEYKKLVQEREAALKKMDETRTSRDPDVIAKAGTDLATKSTALKKMESEAVANDEKVLAAKEEFDKADKEMKALDEEVEGALTSDPDYVTIQQQLEQAETQVKQMTETLAQQQKAEQQAKSAGRTRTTPTRSRDTGDNY